MIVRRSGFIEPCQPSKVARLTSSRGAEDGKRLNSEVGPPANTQASLLPPPLCMEVTSSSSDVVVNAPTGYGSLCDVPFSVFSECGHVWIRTTGGYYGGLRVTVLHNHAVWINGTDALEGPTSDLDTLSVDLDYAASAAHVEAWHLFPSRMFYAAAGNLQATQEMAAREFTRQSFIWNPPLQGQVAFREVVSLPL
jgi:hypothetical protein